jgi:hypothetical protein
MRVRGFIHALKALEPRLGDVVLVGGWAWYLYRKYLTGERSLPGEFTRDVDVALPRRLAAVLPRLDVLLAESAFDRKMEGTERPPVTRYLWPSTENPESTVEFLTPALSSGEKATLEIAGVVAQQLRFLDLLMHEPMILEVEEGSGPTGFAGSVRVPRVGLFVWQKALTFPKRHDRQKRNKDLFYMYDLAEESHGLLAQIEQDVRDFPARGRTRWRRRAVENLVAEFGETDSPGISAVLNQIPEESRPPRRYVRETLGSLISTLQGNEEGTL